MIFIISFVDEINCSFLYYMEKNIYYDRFYNIYIILELLLLKL